MKMIGHTFRWVLLLVVALTMVGPSKSRQMAVKGFELGLILSSGRLPILWEPRMAAIARHVIQLRVVLVVMVMRMAE